jgi:glycine/D-amino acid oxidase-like deaminating enzyme
LGRAGLWDTRPEFMYLRLTADNRIVFGGEGGAIFYDSSPSTGNYRPTIGKLYRSLLLTFPQLEGVRFTHAWGGTLGITKDRMPSIGTMGGAENIFHAVAFNGEGVVMAQLAGRIVADLIAGEETPLTRLVMVNKRMPYIGPEPVRTIGSKFYRRMRRLL